MELDKLAPALVALQADLKPVAKSAVNPFFKSKYAPLPEVMESIQPLLATHKLAIVQFPTNLNGVSALKTILIHESGQKLEADPQPLLMSKQDPQGQGSALTYARRYGIMSVLGLVADEDDDGNKATSSYSVKESSDMPKLSAKEKELSRAKVWLNKRFADLEFSTSSMKLAYIKRVTGKEAISTIEEANEIADALENEYGPETE